MSVGLDHLVDQLADLIALRVARRLSSEAAERGSEVPAKKPDFYSETDLAERSGLSKRTLQGWRQRGGGPRWVKIGAKRVLYPAADADTFFDSRRLRGNSGNRPNMIGRAKDYAHGR